MGMRLGMKQVIGAGLLFGASILVSNAIYGQNDRHFDMDHPVKPTLWLEFHGTEAGVKEQAEMVQEIAADNGGGGFRWTTNEEERNKLWHARHNAAYSAAALRPGRGN